LVGKGESANGDRILNIGYQDIICRNKDISKGVKAGTSTSGSLVTNETGRSYDGHFVVFPISLRTGARRNFYPKFIVLPRPENFQIGTPVNDVVAIVRDNKHSTLHDLVSLVLLH
jgi:hypothetical protein